ncbi:hypothetical protein ACFO6R_01630 [Eubacterium multiforme]|uniref:LTXXQ motif family protein n=1 Tax=Eubacterium multiforme TaxID=83339 RepID=A0ABT9UPH6_9FIRM|nr:hypothetical protein [Eubacterium multiforme]MDQ0148550.1 hypothetical protein [Eubacterium multiforme]
MKNKKKKVIGIIIAVAVLALLIFNTQRETKKINEFKVYLNGHKTEFSQYMIGKEEKEYKKLMKESKDAISYRNVQAMPELEKKLNDLSDKAQKDNKDILTKQLNDIESVNLNKIEKDKRGKIKKQIDTVSNLIKDKKYNDASKIIKDLNKEIYNSISLGN